MFASALLSLALASVTVALDFQRSGCDLSHARINLPKTQPTLPQPKERVSFIALSIGTQNYTCTSAGVYANIGAVAELFDASCIYQTNFQEAAYSLWKAAPESLTPQTIMEYLHSTNTSAILGQHYIIRNPITGIGGSPKWDFSTQGAHNGNANAFVVAAINATIPSPSGPEDAGWIRLTGIQGDLADQIYRVDTLGGQPPATCTPGSPVIAVRYSAKYWIFGGSIKH